MRFLVFGKSGQLARELARLPIDARFLGRGEVDLAQPEAAAQAVMDNAPDAVINAAAWTDVDGAEVHQAQAGVINATAPGAIGQACARTGVPMVHVSTDYVFDGSGDRRWRPDDATGPLGAYGATKLAGEQAIAAAQCTHAILRTSWVFSAHGKNFVKTMLRLSEDRERLTIVADQVGGPTSAAAIANACVRIAAELRSAPAKTGIYHFAGAPDVSWADFARTIFDLSGRNVLVEDIPTSAFPTPAKRPANSRMDCSATEAAFGIVRPDWRADLTSVLDTLKGQS